MAKGAERGIAEGKGTREGTKRIEVGANTCGADAKKPAEIAGAVGSDQVATTVATGRTGKSCDGINELIGEAAGTGSVEREGGTNGGARDVKFAASKVLEEKRGGVGPAGKHF